MALRPDGSGRMRYPPDLAASVRQAIRILLITRPGELRMHPGYGVGLERFVGQPNDVVTRRRIIDAIRNGLLQWEDRILVDRIDVQDIADAPSELHIEIAYRLRRTGTPDSVGVTLDTGA